LVSLLGEKLIGKDGTEIHTSDALGNKAACILYFSAHWCPPCRGFTPAFAAAYEAYRASSGQDAEVVFVSWDRDADQFKEYFAGMPWLALPYESELRKSLGQKFEVNGIPGLVALGPDGAQIVYEGGEDLGSLVSVHKGEAFPMTREHVQKLGEAASNLKVEVCKELSVGGLLPLLRAPGEGAKEIGLAETLASCDHLALLFSDGDLEDGTYKAIANMQREVNGAGEHKRLGVLYIGYTRYNDFCDHHALFEKHQTQFCGLLEPAEDIKDRLGKLPSQGGIQAPHLIVLGKNDKGTLEVLLDDPGCQKAQQAGAKGYPWTAARLAELKAAEEARVEALKQKQANLQILKGSSDSVLGKDGKEVKVDALAALGPDAVIGLYFSAHWCPPCRGFTPVLAKCYKELKESGKNFEVVFVSGDKDEEAFQEYFNEMPWLALPFSDRDLKQDLNKVFQVNGIPTLVLLKADGTLITDEGRDAISFGAEFFPWSPEDMERGQAEAQKKEQEKAAAAIADEAKALEEQTATGGPVLKRLRGSPGTALAHVISSRTVEFFEFATLGAPDSLATSGVLYYEVEICKGLGIPQVGFAAPGFVTCDEGTGEGVGDDKLSWGFDGVRKLAWYGGDAAWDCSWAEGDVIGFAANIEAGKIAVSKNGTWSESPLGVFFENDVIKSGVYPCMTAGHGYTIRYNLDGSSHGDYKYGPPPADVWTAAAKTANAGYPA
jgi:nucleoredoxin